MDAGSIQQDHQKLLFSPLEVFRSSYPTLLFFILFLLISFLIVILDFNQSIVDIKTNLLFNHGLLCLLYFFNGHNMFDEMTE